MMLSLMRPPGSGRIPGPTKGPVSCGKLERKNVDDQTSVYQDGDGDQPPFVPVQRAECFMIQSAPIKGCPVALELVKAGPYL
jgi:hypothetical protein